MKNLEEFKIIYIYSIFPSIINKKLFIIFFNKLN